MVKDKNYDKITEAIKFLAGNFKNQPSLGEVANHVNISSYHFQRVFTEHALKLIILFDEKTLLSIS